MFKRMLRWLIPITFTLGMMFQPICSTANVDFISHADRVYTVMISDSFGSADEVRFRKETSGDMDELRIIINSPGGRADILAGMMMHVEDLKARGVHITTEVTHEAMSAGAFLWIMGDTRIAHKTSQLMFHQAYYSDGYGNMLDCSVVGPKGCWMINTLNSYIRQIMLNQIHDTDLVNRLFKVGMDNFLTGQEAFDLGLATEIK